METVVLNDFRSIWQAFKKEEFLGRPKNIAFNVLINLEGKWRAVKVALAPTPSPAAEPLLWVQLQMQLAQSRLVACKRIY